MAVQQSHLRFLHPSLDAARQWYREAAITVNGLLRGGPFPLLWRDNLRDMTSIRLGAAINQPTWSTFLDGTGAYLFSDTVENEVFASFHIDHDYARGTDIYPHVHWTADAEDTDVVRWGFEYTCARGHQQEIFPATTTVYAQQNFNGISWTHMIAEVDDANVIPGVALMIEPDSLIVMRIFRDATNEIDTLATSVFGLFVDLHYQLERRGTPNRKPNFYGP